MSYPPIIYPSVYGIHPSHENHCAAATLCSPKRDDVLSAISPNIPPALSPSPSMKYQSCNYNDAHAGTPYDLSLSRESTLALEHNRMLYAETGKCAESQVVVGSSSDKQAETKHSSDTLHVVPTPDVGIIDSDPTAQALFNGSLRLVNADSFHTTEPTALPSAIPQCALEQNSELSLATVSSTTSLTTDYPPTSKCEHNTLVDFPLGSEDSLVSSIVARSITLTGLDTRDGMLSSDELLPISDALPTNVVDGLANDSKLERGTDLHPGPSLISCTNEDHSSATTADNDKCSTPTIDPPPPQGHPPSSVPDFDEPEEISLELVDIRQETNDGYASPTPTYSSLPSSSPPRIFSSSPPLDASATPPSSSPVFTGQRDATDEDDSDFIIKNDVASRYSPKNDTIATMDYSVQEADTHAKPELPTDIQDELTDSPLATFPNTRKLTPASQKKQHKILAKPFRSPILSNDSPLLSGHGAYDKQSLERKNETSSEVPITAPVKDAPPVADSSAFKDYTKKAAKQFKSPFTQAEIKRPTPSSTPTGPTESSMYPSLSIQALQGKVQKLKQAIKIKQDRDAEEDDHLAVLISKWRAAGREIAWEVWDTVKDAEHGDMGIGNPFKGGWNQDDALDSRTKRERDGWSFEGERDVKKMRVSEEACDAEMQVGDDYQAVPQHTLGTMLRFMAIAPETLGWDEGEGDFVGEP